MDTILDRKRDLLARDASVLTTVCRRLMREICSLGCTSYSTTVSNDCHFELLPCTCVDRKSYPDCLILETKVQSTPECSECFVVPHCAMHDLAALTTDILLW